MSNRKKNRTIGLRSFLILMISGILVVSMIAMLGIPTVWFRDLIYNQTERYCTQIIKQTRDGIGQVIQSIDGKLMSLTRTNVVYNDLCKNANPSATSADFRASFLDFFPTFDMEYHYIKSVDLYAKRTGKLFRVGYCPLVLDEPFESDYRQAALASPVMLNWIGYNQELDALEIVKLIYDTQTYEELGLLIVRVLPALFMDEFGNFAGLDIHDMYLLDQQGRKMSSLDVSRLNQQVDTRIFREHGNGAQMFKWDGLTYISSDFSGLNLSQYYTAPYSDWRIVIEIDTATLYLDFNTTLARILITGATIAMVSLIAVLLFSRSVTRPILDVAEGFKRIEREDYTTAIDITSFIAEPAAIINGYNHMLSHLNHLINSIFRERMAADELRFKSLQAKINPHFLFNTLQTISWKARAHHADDVSSMIKSLSYMLESGLSSDNSHFITLAEELKYIRHYIYIIHCKYEDKINILIDVPEALHDLKIPRLTLQPLIENAVTHGLGPKLGDGTVSVRAAQVEEMLRITIDDDGVGIPPEKLADIQRDITSVAPGAGIREPVADGHNIALRNIYHRLTILYSSHFSLALESQRYMGTRVTLTIPLSSEEDEHV